MNACLPLVWVQMKQFQNVVFKYHCFFKADGQTSGRVRSLPLTAFVLPAGLPNVGASVVARQLVIRYQGWIRYGSMTNTTHPGFFQIPSCVQLLHVCPLAGLKLTRISSVQSG
jgi:hypothetical protein